MMTDFTLVPLHNKLINVRDFHQKSLGLVPPDVVVRVASIRPQVHAESDPESICSPGLPKSIVKVITGTGEIRQGGEELIAVTPAF